MACVGWDLAPRDRLGRHPGRGNFILRLLLFRLRWVLNVSVRKVDDDYCWGTSPKESFSLFFLIFLTMQRLRAHVGPHEQSIWPVSERKNTHSTKEKRWTRDFTFVLRVFLALNIYAPTLGYQNVLKSVWLHAPLRRKWRCHAMHAQLLDKWCWLFIAIKQSTLDGISLTF